MNVDPRTLMAYYDGELTAAEAEAVEQQLQSDAQAQAVLAGLSQVGDFVRAAEAERLGAADGIADGVMARIEREVPRAAPRDPKRSRRFTLGVVAPVALAAAAAGVLWISGNKSDGTARAPVAQPTLSAPAAALAPAPEPTVAALQAPAADQAPAISIESVEFGPRTGSIFMIPAGEAETPVVWLLDEPEAPTRPRMEPL